MIDNEPLKLFKDSDVKGCDNCLFGITKTCSEANIQICEIHNYLCWKPTNHRRQEDNVQNS